MENKTYIELLKERVNLRTLLIAILIAISGTVLIFAAAFYLSEFGAWQSVVQELGGLLFVSGTITILWDLFGKRAFLDEILAKAGVSKEIEHAGIIKITDSFHDKNIDWKLYFSSVNKLDIFFAYGSTWRHIHVEELRSVAHREGARIRVVLPDPEDNQTVSELARRFSMTPEELKGRIRESETEFKKLQESVGTKGAEIHLWFLPAAPVSTFYRFDNIAILALYTHRKERESVPTFICESGGTLYDFIYKEFDAMIRTGGLARLVF